MWRSGAEGGGCGTGLEEEGRRRWRGALLGAAAAAAGLCRRHRRPAVARPGLRIPARRPGGASARAVQAMTAKLRVIPGRYQLTSTTAKLPVTLVNSFDTPTVVNLSLIPLNSRIRVENVYNVKLAAKSRQQLTLEVNVIAPGSVLVNAQFMNSEGQLVGEQSELALSATIIDSRVAWFTTGAAVLLLLGAITQSVRRVRRSRQ